MPIANKTNKPKKVEDKNRVDLRSSNIEGMADEGEWYLIDSLWGGTRTMRAAGHDWLPQEPLESVAMYHNRLSRSFLYNGFKSTIRKYVAKPFSKPVVLQNEPASGMLTELYDDVDFTGRDLSQLGRDMFEAGLRYGITYLLVDFPKLQPDATLGEERETGAHPSFIHIRPHQFLGARVARSSIGPPKVLQIRWMEKRTEPDGMFGDIEVTYVRVYGITGWQLWRLDPDKEPDEEGAWQKMGEGPILKRGRPIREVPLKPFYINRTGFLTAVSPFLDLAWKNLEHWQSSSDQRNILRFSRFGMIYGTGVSDEEQAKIEGVGPQARIFSENENAKFGILEHTGAAVGAGRQDLVDLVEQMATLGVQPLIGRSGDTTATARAIDEASVYCDAMAWVRTLENTLTDAYAEAADWTGENLPEDFKPEINSDFGLNMNDVKGLDALVKSRQNGDVDQMTYLQELQRRGILGELVDLEGIVATTDNEVNLGLVNSPQPDPEEDDEEEEENDDE